MLVVLSKFAVGQASGSIYILTASVYISRRLFTLGNNNHAATRINLHDINQQLRRQQNNNFWSIESTRSSAHTGHVVPLDL
jgi:hypothetical protein